MTTSLFAGIIILCGIFAVGEVLSKFTKYKIPTLVIAMFAFIIFGGQFGIIPEDTVAVTGFCDITYSWGLPFVIASFGTSITLKGLKSEGRTVAIALCTVALIVGLGALAGCTIINMTSAIFGAVEVAGGGQAAMVFIKFAQEHDNARLVALVLCVMNMQIILGYPVCNYGIRRSMQLRIKNGLIPELPTNTTQDGQEKKPLIHVPDFLRNNFFYVMFVLGIICLVSGKIGDLVGLSPYIFYIIFGFVFAELGLLEHNCLAKVGCMSVLMDILYLSLMADFVTMKLGDVGIIAVEFFVVMIAGLIGCILTGILMGKLFKLDFYEVLGLSIACMVGYPVTLNIATEALTAVRQECEISDDTAARLKAYYDPKIVISGVVSISLVTGILAGIIISFI